MFCDAERCSLSCAASPYRAKKKVGTVSSRGKEVRENYTSVFERKTKRGLKQAALRSGTLRKIKGLIDEVLSDEIEGLGDVPVKKSIGDDNSSAISSDPNPRGLTIYLHNFYENLGKFYELNFICDNVDRVFLRSYFNNQLKEFVAENTDKTTKYKGVEIESIKQDKLPEFERRYRRYGDICDATSHLHPSMLLSIVATFDTLFADLSKSLLKLRPERYDSSDRQYSVAELLAMSRDGDFIDQVISDEVDSLMNRSHAEQIKFFEKSFSVSISEKFNKWPNYLEIFERRNLIAHGGARVNKRYIENCERHKIECKFEEGDEIIVDFEYIKCSIDTMIEFGTILAFAAWLKQVPDDRDDAFQAMNDICYDLLKLKRSRVAKELLELCLNDFGKLTNDMMRKMMTVNLAIALRKMNNDKAAFAALDREDWSASSPMFQTCVYAVRGDVKNASGFLPKAKATSPGDDGISLEDVAEWPAFDWVRDMKMFQNKVRSEFGQGAAPEIDGESLISDVDVG
jgi:hypothetical protein